MAGPVWLGDPGRNDPAWPGWCGRGGRGSGPCQRLGSSCALAVARAGWTAPAARARVAQAEPGACQYPAATTSHGSSGPGPAKRGGPGRGWGAAGVPDPIMCDRLTRTSSSRTSVTRRRPAEGGPPRQHRQALFFFDSECGAGPTWTSNLNPVIHYRPLPAHWAVSRWWRLISKIRARKFRTDRALLIVMSEEARGEPAHCSCCCVDCLLKRLCQRGSHTICVVTRLTSFLAVCFNTLGSQLKWQYSPTV